MVEVEEVEVKEETYRLALESTHRWIQRWYDNDFQEQVVLRAIEQVVDTALSQN